MSKVVCFSRLLALCRVLLYQKRHEKNEDHPYHHRSQEYLLRQHWFIRHFCRMLCRLLHWLKSFSWAWANMQQQSKHDKSGTLRQIPKGVWVLGFVSMLMDISSEMIHVLLPMFMVGTLGMRVFYVGLIEGLAEATAMIVRVFSGALSDYIGKRKSLTLRNNLWVKLFFY